MEHSFTPLILHPEGMLLPSLLQNLVKEDIKREPARNSLNLQQIKTGSMLRASKTVHHLRNVLQSTDFPIRKKAAVPDVEEEPYGGHILVQLLAVALGIMNIEYDFHSHVTPMMGATLSTLSLSDTGFTKHVFALS